MLKIKKAYGTHLPLLIKAVQFTTGSVVECGCGHHSTPFLHWACFDSDRKLYSYEYDKNWYELFTNLYTEQHTIQYVKDWDLIDLNFKIGLAFIDHRPAERRWIEIKRLSHADMIVVHDTDHSKYDQYGYRNIITSFKYKFTYTKTRPKTSVFSNTLDVGKLFNE